ncbi:ribosomal protein L21 [Allomyces macrogynus ATCC 38327]|uniref:Large ribosomal subunit protein bL21m n=1 Tax=Allomyces macrogynus (strain ATCC 38327) TaxID=578462 RepID=A0A0L0T9D5_ALLM3|nr:ribosomal protein L21 [Allomyces macrogynus ATCC 38327]|eukprot:KNE71331.1 ribosomal protein L21 [Allomyces macrogynus ATCC 38327]
MLRSLLSRSATAAATSAPRQAAAAARPAVAALASRRFNTTAVTASPTPAATTATPALTAESVANSKAAPYLMHLAQSAGPYYALLEIKGRPYHVTKGDMLQVQHLKVPLGAKLVLDKVREIGSASVSLRGAPYVAENLARVEAVVIEHSFSEKRVTVKTKRRKGYKRTHGHRQHLTSLRITEVSVQPLA